MQLHSLAYCLRYLLTQALLLYLFDQLLSSLKWQLDGNADDNQVHVSQVKAQLFSICISLRNVFSRSKKSAHIGFSRTLQTATAHWSAAQTAPNLHPAQVIVVTFCVGPPLFLSSVADHNWQQQMTSIIGHNCHLIFTSVQQ